MEVQLVCLLEKQTPNSSEICEKMFESWHISSVTGFATRELKQLLKKIWDSDKGEVLLNAEDGCKELSKTFLTDHNLKLNGVYKCKVNSTIPNEDWIFFSNLSKNNSIPDLQMSNSILRATKKRGLSLLELSAAAVSFDLQSVDDIKSLIDNGEVPPSLENILIKYV